MNIYIRQLAFQGIRNFSTKTSILPNTRIVPTLEKKLDQLIEQHDSILNQLSNNQLKSFRNGNSI
ncbi:unnamed protein product [Cunninghamella echinulata]